MPSILLKRDYKAGSYYHIKHTAKKGTTLFESESDYKTFVLLLSYYLRFPDATPLSWVKRLNPKTVVDKRNKSELGATPVSLHHFLLLPDHFHLVLKENQGGKKPGISNLMRRLSVGYAMYYNKTYGVNGTIYVGKYKNIEVPQPDLSPLIESLQAHANVNSTFMNSPLHSSSSDYTGTARPWLTPLPLNPNDNTKPNPRLILDK
ncbi:MAG: hypothetical protein E6P95_01045 [Candidatus Moraniibacteriota bacterium]|nr:MAG: hypothetical protein E6P95_01045 [Candidatus Moranbacteria bacterium]